MNSAALLLRSSQLSSCWSRPFDLILSYESETKQFSNYINTSEIPSELPRENFISSHVKRTPSLWLHNKSHLWKQADLVFHWCLYNKQNITYSLMDKNFIFSCSTRYLTSERSEDKIHIHPRACNIFYILYIVGYLGNSTWSHLSSITQSQETVKGARVTLKGNSVGYFNINL